MLQQPNLIDALKLWYEDNQIYQDAYPIYNYLNLTEAILVDGIITPEEEQILEHWYFDEAATEADRKMELTNP